MVETHYQQMRSPQSLARASDASILRFGIPDSHCFDWHDPVARLLLIRAGSIGAPGGFRSQDVGRILRIRQDVGPGQLPVRERRLLG